MVKLPPILDVGGVLISSDLPEVMGMSDRLMVVREGRIVAEHQRGEATAEQIMGEMFGIASDDVKGA